MEDSLDLAKYLSIFRRWLWFIALCTLGWVLLVMVKNLHPAVKRVIERIRWYQDSG